MLSKLVNRVFKSIIGPELIQDSFVNQLQSRLKKNPDSTYRNPGLQFVEHSVRNKGFCRYNNKCMHVYFITLYFSVLSIMTHNNSDSCMNP